MSSLTLTLTIDNFERLQRGVAPSHQFDSRGGTIGSQGTDWLLNDATQQIQPLHCEIRWAEGSFCVIDHCSQTFLNGSRQSLGQVAPVRLQEGDCLRIGAYDLHIHCYPYDGTGDPKRRSLGELLAPPTCVLDALVRHLPQAPSPFESAVPRPSTAFDICQLFEPAIGCDPLVALEDRTVLQQADESPLLTFFRGGRP
jgi:type VI secretion system protein ImpI